MTRTVARINRSIDDLGAAAAEIEAKLNSHKRGDVPYNEQSLAECVGGPLDGERRPHYVGDAQGHVREIARNTWAGRYTLELHHDPPRYAWRPDGTEAGA